jgi:hypothetical protein
VRPPQNTTTAPPRQGTEPLIQRKQTVIKSGPGRPIFFLNATGYRRRRARSLSVEPIKGKPYRINLTRQPPSTSSLYLRLPRAVLTSLNNMHLHRLNTQNLPSIRVHDQNSMDTMSDHHSSPNSQRSLPREIPIPKHGSPSSSRCGSYLGSTTSTTIPPILSLDPPPILSLDPPGASSLPPPNYHHFRHPDSFGSIGGGEDGSEGQRPRKSVLDIRDRGSHGWNKLSPIGRSWNDDADLSSSRDGPPSMKSEDSYERHWREGFYGKINDRASPKELVNPVLITFRLHIYLSVDTRWQW